MCLKYIGKRESMNEGIGYKVLTRHSNGILKTSILDYPVIADTWLLHQEPKHCTSLQGFKCFTYQSKEVLDGMNLVLRFQYELQRLYDVFPSTITGNWCVFLNDTYEYFKTDVHNYYDHGFHLYKNNNVGHPVQRFKVYYKDIIAEDSHQIVAKQIYICDKTSHPSESEVKADESKSLVDKRC